MLYQFHTRERLRHIERWQEQGIMIVLISAYSPELNIIEIAWRKIKYEWIPFSAYESYESLKQALSEILAGIGSHYKIQFE